MDLLQNVKLYMQTIQQKEIFSQKKYFSSNLNENNIINLITVLMKQHNMLFNKILLISKIPSLN